MKRPSNPVPVRRLFLGLLLLLLPSLAPVRGAGQSSSAQLGSAPGLVRLRLEDAAAKKHFAGLNLPIYYQVPSPQGELVLLPAAFDQRTILARSGLAPALLDGNTARGSYFLVSAYGPHRLDLTASGVQVLALWPRQALVRGEETQIAALPARGLELQRLVPHPYQPAPAQASLPDLPKAIKPELQVEALLEQITPSRVSALTGELSGEAPVVIGGDEYTIATRYTLAAVPISRATQFAYEYFAGLGLTPAYHEYTLSGSGTRRNVIAEQPGVAHPERIVLLTAHLDSTATAPGDDPYTYAPGADDNASGSVGVLLAAEVLRQLPFDCTLRYALFTGEEQGLIGSQAYAYAVSNAGEGIQAVLNLDMIAYNSDANPIIELHTRAGNADDLALAELFSQVIDAYDLALEPEIVASNIGASDHASFWDYGYPAILAIEDFENFTPYYHSRQDRLETLDLDYFSAYVQAAVGSLAHLGCLRTPLGSLSGTIRDSDSGDPLPETLVTARNPAAETWSKFSGATGAYELALETGTYTVTVAHSSYLSTTANGVLIQEDAATRLDVDLHTNPAANTWFPLIFQGLP